MSGLEWIWAFPSEISFGIMRHKAHRIEGTRFKVNLLLLWLVSELCRGYGQHSPGMHRVWIRVDSGVPVKKLLVQCRAVVFFQYATGVKSCMSLTDKAVRQPEN